VCRHASAFNIDVYLKVRPTYSRVLRAATLSPLAIHWSRSFPRSNEIGQTNRVKKTLVTDLSEMSNNSALAGSTKSLQTTLVARPVKWITGHATETPAISIALFPSVDTQSCFIDVSPNVYVTGCRWRSRHATFRGKSEAGGERGSFRIHRVRPCELLI